MSPALKLRVILTLLLIPGVIWLQVAFFRSKVPGVSPEKYEKQAVTLKVADGFRYGFIVGQHGATLVRATARDDGQNDTAVEAEAEIVTVMRAALEAVPRNTVWEGLFYLGVATFTLFGTPFLFRKLCAGSAGPLRKAVVAGTLAAAALFVFLLPRTTADYGASAFTTWAGPFPRSFSGPYPRMSGVPGETVSYRNVQEVVLLPIIATGSPLYSKWYEASKSLTWLTILEFFHLGDSTLISLNFWVFILGIPFAVTATVEYVLVRLSSARMPKGATHGDAA